jgi:hypothetical protein
MPGFVKLTDAATGGAFYEAIDLIVLFNDAASDPWPHMPSSTRSVIYAGPRANSQALRDIPAHFVQEDPETVQRLVRTELQRIFGQPAPSL